MKDPIKKSAAIPLRSINFRETSKIITAFTEQFGKVQLVAKGVRKPKSRMAAALQNLVHAEIVFYMRETQDLYLVKDATVVDFFEHIHGDLTRFAHATVITDFLNTLLASEQVSRTLFQYSVFTLAQMDSTGKKELPAVLTRYLLKASSLIGFRMELDACAACGKREPATVFFSHDAGGVVCESCRHTDPQASKLDPLLRGFMKASQQEHVTLPAMEPVDCKKLFQLLSNWFYFHTNRVLKTLNNHIHGEPFHVYDLTPSEQEVQQLSDKVQTFYEEE